MPDSLPLSFLFTSIAVPRRSIPEETAFRCRSASVISCAAEALESVPTTFATDSGTVIGILTRKVFELSAIEHNWQRKFGTISLFYCAEPALGSVTFSFRLKKSISDQSRLAIAFVGDIQIPT